MSKQKSSLEPRTATDLRTGLPYANIIANQIRFAEAVGAYFGISDTRVVPTTGAMGAIEAIRNHVLKKNRESRPVLLTVCPGYWRARESFDGIGFDIAEIRTQQRGFTIDESEIIDAAYSVNPAIIYLSLPNNPTGALFDPLTLIAGIREDVTILLDMTLPTPEMNSREIAGDILQKFNGRANVFIAGSTSKSHKTAEYRIGWALCASAEAGAEIRSEYRAAVASPSIEAGLAKVGREPEALPGIMESFSLLESAEQKGYLEIIRPGRMGRTAYVLVRINRPADELKRILDGNSIRVFWGSELGLTNEYLRLELLEPENINVLLRVLAS